MLSDGIAQWDDGELHTITGFSWERYQSLEQRLSRPDAELEDIDEAMLTEAAKQFFGYPGMTTASAEAVLGVGWKQTVESAFLSQEKK